MGIPEDSAGWLELIRHGQPPFWREMVEASGSELWEAPGVFAAIFPSTPERSVFNSVFYEDEEALIDSLDEITSAYEEAGVLAWTVWVPEADREVARALEARGHVLDATPRAMATEISQLTAPAADPELEIREELDFELLARINETAYGFPAGDFAAVANPLPSTRLYFGSYGGETLGCAAAYAHGSDCEITWVAVLPEGRGRGMSARLMARGLADAAEQGLETTTLQSTKLGYPVYVKLGYRDYGELQMWERRRTAASE